MPADDDAWVDFAEMIDQTGRGGPGPIASRRVEADIGDPKPAQHLPPRCRFCPRPPRLPLALRFYPGHRHLARETGWPLPPKPGANPGFFRFVIGPSFRLKAPAFCASGSLADPPTPFGMPLPGWRSNASYRARARHALNGFPFRNLSCLHAAKRGFPHTHGLVARTQCRPCRRPPFATDGKERILAIAPACHAVLPGKV